MKVLVLSDEQIPFHDEHVIVAVHRYLRDLQPDAIIHNGDMLDLPGLATKFTRKNADLGRLDKDLAIAKAMLTEERKLAPRAKIIVLEGNHEDRLRLYVQENASELEPLLADQLSLARMLALPGVEWRGGYSAGNAYWEHGGLVITHGSDITFATAGKTMLLREGSVIYGHTHHADMYAFSNRLGQHRAWSFGCLCNVTGANMPPRGSKSQYANWQQGFGLVHFGRRVYNVYDIAVNGGFVSPDGKEYVA